MKSFMTTEVVVTIVNPNHWPERNQGKLVFSQMIENEYQFTMKTDSREVAVTFYKGTWSIKLDGGDIISIDDNGEVTKCDNDYLAAFFKAKIEARLDKTRLEFRKIAGSVIWDALVIVLKGLREENKIEFIVHLAGRNGLFDTEGNMMLVHEGW